MGSEYKKIEEHHKSKFTDKLIYNTGFKKTNVKRQEQNFI